MTSPAEISIRPAGGRGKRILRFLLWTLAGIFVFCVLIIVASRSAARAAWGGIEAERATGLSGGFALARARSSSLLQSIGDQEINRAASLLLATRDFDSVRSRMEGIVRSHEGYVDELEVGGRQGTGRTLAATLRVPVEEFDATLAELKALGYAEQESQSSEELGSETESLDAKLAAARVTEDRLNRLVRERSGRLGEYLEVEQEIAKVRGQIEELVARQERHAERIRYGAIRLSLKEQYTARFDIQLATLSAGLRSSIVDGLQGTIRQGSAGLSVVFRYGPILLFWTLLLYWPIRLAWRRVGALLATRNALGRGAAMHT